NPNRVITKDELLKAVWADSFVEEGNLTQNVFLLRKALGQKFEDSGLIVTIPRKGYQFGAEVTVVSQTAHPSEMPGQDTATAVSPAASKETERQSGDVLALPLTVVAKPIPSGSSAKLRARLAALLSAAAIILVVAGYLFWQHFHTAPAALPKKLMLAVLPFQ